MLNLAGLVVAASMVVGQADSVPEGEDLLKQFGDAMVGNWESKDVAKEDFLDIVKKGDTVEGKATIRWICKKKALSVNWSYSNGKRTDQGRTLIAWDAKLGAIREFGVSTLGGFGKTTTTMKDGKWVSKMTVVLSNDAQISSVSTLTIADDGNTHIHETTERKGPDGNSLPNQTQTWKRVKD